MNVRRTYYAIGALNWFATVLPMAVMVLLAQSRGLSLSEIGLYLGLYSLTIMLLELPSGALADSVGRKRVLLAAYALAAVSRVVFLFAFDLAVFLAFAVLSGAARALSSGALEAWFIDSLQDADPEVDLQPALATGNSFHLAGLAVGTLTGGLLPQLFAHLPTASTAVITPLSTTVVASVLVQLGVVAFTALIMREARPAILPTSNAAVGLGGTCRRGLGSLALVLGDAYELTRRSRTLQLLLSADLVIGIVLTASELLWQPFYAANVGIGASETHVLGVVLAGCFGMGMVGNLAATPLSRLLKNRFALVSGLFQLLQGASFVLLAWQTNLVLATAFYWSTYFLRSAWSSPHATLFN
ncbi:MAG TPA: MFS transporter, partial [Trueperaceae bacterium]|nr:MFS transporter [Trueperaceae bacterium]